MPIPLEQRGQPIVRPCSLTRASVTHQRFCVAAGSGALFPGAASTLTFGLVRVPHCRSTGNSPGPTTIEVFGLELNGSPESLSTYSRLHLADSGCRLMVRNLRTPRARRRTSALPCFLSFPTRPAPASSLRTCHAPALIQVPEHKRFRRNRQVRLGSCCSEALHKVFSRQLVHDTFKRPSNSVISSN